MLPWSDRLLKCDKDTAEHSTPAAGQGERGAGREVGFRVKVRKARKKKTVQLLSSVVETNKVRYTV